MRKHYNVATGDEFEVYTSAREAWNRFYGLARKGLQVSLGARVGDNYNIIGMGIPTLEIIFTVGDVKSYIKGHSERFTKLSDLYQKMTDGKSIWDASFTVWKYAMK